MFETIFSVDLEDWDTSAYLRDYVTGRDTRPKIVEATVPILELLEKHGVKATFFVLGVLAERFPDLIKNIAQRGHEIASHGYSHTPLWNLTQESFRHELITTNLIIEDIVGIKPLGFRAPYASLDSRTSWAINILEQEGFKYDSSIFPMITPLYGVPNAPLCGYKISSKNIYENNPEGKIVEVPFTIFKFGPIKIPCTGGFYGRVLPAPVLKYFFKAINRFRPVNFYFHPWETFADIPKIKAPLFNKFVSYFNVKSYLRKIEHIVNAAKCITFIDYAESIMNPGAEQPASISQAFKG
jgi:peptidoglycan-N-acetylglucosamine deacetylase